MSDWPNSELLCLESGHKNSLLGPLDTGFGSSFTYSFSTYRLWKNINFEADLLFAGKTETK